MNYQKAYKILFNRITDALAELDEASDKSPGMMRAETILQSAQRQTENMYMETED